MYSSWLAETINAQNRLYVYVYGWSKHAQFEYALERLQVRDEKRVGQVRWGGGGGGRGLVRVVGGVQSYQSCT